MDRLESHIKLRSTSPVYTTKDYTPEEVRKVVIESNLNAYDPYIASCQLDEHHFSHNPYYEQILRLFKACVQERTFHNPNFWKLSAISVAMIALAAFSRRYLTNAYKNFIQKEQARYAEYAKKYVIVSQFGTFRRNATYEDFIPSYGLYCSIGIITYLAGIILLAAKALRQLEEIPIYKLSPIYSRQVTIQEPSNQKEGGNWLDPITLDPISENKVRSPSSIHLKPYIFDFKSFTTSLLHKKSFSHPIEDRLLSEEEKAIVLGHICNLYNVDENTFLNLWEQGKSSDEEKRTIYKTHKQLFHPLLNNPDIRVMYTLQSIQLSQIITEITTLLYGEPRQLDEIFSIENSLKDKAKTTFETFNQKVLDKLNERKKLMTKSRQDLLHAPFYNYNSLDLSLLPTPFGIQTERQTINGQTIELRYRLETRREYTFGYIFTKTFRIDLPPNPAFYVERNVKISDENILWEAFISQLSDKSYPYIAFKCGEETIIFRYNRTSVFLYDGFLAHVEAIAREESERSDFCLNHVLPKIKAYRQEIKQYIEREVKLLQKNLEDGILSSFAPSTETFQSLVREFEQNKRIKIFCSTIHNLEV